MSQNEKLFIFPASTMNFIVWCGCFDMLVVTATAYSCSCFSEKVEDMNGCLSRLEQRFMMLCCAPVASADDGGRFYFPLLESGLWWSALVRRMLDLAWSCCTSNFQQALASSHIGCSGHCFHASRSVRCETNFKRVRSLRCESMLLDEHVCN